MSDMYNFTREFEGARYYAGDVTADDPSTITVDINDISTASDLYNYNISYTLNMQLHMPG